MITLDGTVSIISRDVNRNWIDVQLDGLAAHMRVTLPVGSYGEFTPGDRIKLSVTKAPG